MANTTGIPAPTPDLRRAVRGTLGYLAAKHGVLPPTFSFEPIYDPKINAEYVTGSTHISFYRIGPRITSHEFWHYMMDKRGIDPVMNVILGDDKKEADRFAEENAVEVGRYWNGLQPYVAYARSTEMAKVVLTGVFTGLSLAAGIAIGNLLVAKLK